jgi:hypothetical protein
VFLDQPPVVLLEDSGILLREGVASSLRLAARDDLGITSRSVIINGQAQVLPGDGAFTYTPSQVGIVDITGSVTDTGGQTASSTWRLYVADASGVLPFDPSTLGATGEEGAADIRVFSPAAGDVVAESVPIIASIGGPSVPSWAVAYAPVELVDPYDLETPDADYLPLASGIGYRTSEVIGTFPGHMVGSGIYFLRIKATPSGGGRTRCSHASQSHPLTMTP